MKSSQILRQNVTSNRKFMVEIAESRKLYFELPVDLSLEEFN